METRLTVPVLFLIFRQPEITRAVFEQIRAARPSKLYISADGPRPNRPDDIADCEATRAVVANVDWDCEVLTRFLPGNLGLKKAVSSALDWFFEAEEEGIILEYDCLPEPSFFPYCKTLLERYRHDQRIFSVSGSNIQASETYGNGDYYLSRFTQVWGWATWRRSWLLWRPNLENYEDFLNQKTIESIVTVKEAQNFWLKTFKSINSGENKTTWAFCLIYAQLRSGGFCVIPKNNMICNIGFGPNGTNALDANHPLSLLTTSETRTYQEPVFFIPCLEADNSFSLKAGYSPKKSAIRVLLQRIGVVMRIVLKTN